MLADIPDSRAPLALRFFDTSEIVSVLEEQDAPILLRYQVEVLVHILALDLLNDKVDVILRLFEISLARVQPDFVEVSVDDFAAELLEMMQQFQEGLFHQLLNESVHERVVELGVRVCYPAISVHD